jgi:hypothetical protein
MLETRATGKQLKSMLSSITKESMTSGGALGDMSNLWELLPDNVAGPIWVAEVVDASTTLADWLDDEREYSLDDLRDMSGQLADSETEDYYSNINKRVQELSLWAITDLDEEVVSTYAAPLVTLTDMNSAYLYCAMRGLYETLMQWVMDRAEELEESVA